MNVSGLRSIARRIVVTSAVSAVALAPAAAGAVEDPNDSDLAPQTPTAEQDPGSTPPAVPTDPAAPGGESDPQDPVDPPEGQSEPTPPQDPAQPEPESPDEKPLPELAEGLEQKSEVAPDAEDGDLNVLAADYGYGKQSVLIGADEEPGIWVPEGTTTAGTVLRIVETGPDVEGGSTETTCTTVAGPPEETVTYCPGLYDPVASSSTVTVSVVSMPDGYVFDDETTVVEPCGLESPSDLPFCDPVEVVYLASGIPPIANDDAETTEQDTPVLIDVLANDDPVNGAPLVDFGLVSGAENGDVEVVLDEDDYPSIGYVPAEGFSGTDTFEYGFATPNGEATATVTVTVEPGIEPVAEIEDDPAPVAEVTASLPDAGGSNISLLGWGAALVAAGAGALALGRRRESVTD